MVCANGAADTRSAYAQDLPVVAMADPNTRLNESAPTDGMHSANVAQTADAAAMTQAALREVEGAASAIRADMGTSTLPASEDSLRLQDFGSDQPSSQEPTGIGLLNDVELRVTVELGRTNMYVEDVLRLNESSVIELDKAAGDPVDIYVNDRHVARGEVLVLNENFCVRISELVQAGSGDDDSG